MTNGHTFDIIVPEYNELSRSPKDFEKQLDYFSKLSQKYNVSIIDDASSDGSGRRIREHSQNENVRYGAFLLKRNGQKVGAIKKGINESNAEFAVLTDFDSELTIPSRYSAC